MQSVAILGNMCKFHPEFYIFSFHLHLEIMNFPTRKPEILFLNVTLNGYDLTMLTWFWSFVMMTLDFEGVDTILHSQAIDIWLDFKF